MKIKCSLIIFLCLIFLFNCDPAFNYDFILNNQSNDNLYINIILEEIESTSDGYNSQDIIAEYRLKPGEQIILDNTGDWLIGFQVYVSKNGKDYIDVTGKENWIFYKKVMEEETKGVYELRITSKIFSTLDK